MATNHPRFGALWTEYIPALSRKYHDRLLQLRTTREQYEMLIRESYNREAKLFLEIGNSGFFTQQEMGTAMLYVPPAVLKLLPHEVPGRKEDTNGS